MDLNAVVSERIVHRGGTAAGPTQVLIFPHGGMGDRVVFELLVREALARAAGARVVAAVPYQATDYNARHYVPAPAEVWGLRNPPSDETMGEVHRCAMERFGSLGPVETTFFGARNDHPPRVPGATWKEPYGLLLALAGEGRFPRFHVRPSARLAVREELSRAGVRPGEHQLVGLHCRSRPGEAVKNVAPADVLAVAHALRRTPTVRLLVLGAEDVPEALLEVADVRDVGQADPSLQRLGALLEACAVFVGGDSGPTHLAAAVGTPAVAMVAADREALWGPFAPAGRAARALAKSRTGDGPLRFEVAQVVSLVESFLGGGPR